MKLLWLVALSHLISAVACSNTIVQRYFGPQDIGILREALLSVASP